MPDSRVKSNGAFLRLGHRSPFLFLVLPSILMLVGFFIVPVSGMLARSFHAGAGGVAILNEVATPITQDGTLYRLANGPIVDTNGDGRIDGTDLRDIAFVRTIRLIGLNAERSAIVLDRPPAQDETILVSYNDAVDEVGVRDPRDPRVIRLGSTLTRDRNRDSRLDAADLVVRAARAAEAVSVDGTAQTIQLAQAPGDDEVVLVSYNYAPQLTLAHYVRALGSTFYWDWRFWRPSLFRTTFEIAFFTTLACIILGYPVAYFLARVGKRWRTALLPLIVVPFWTSILIRTFAWQIILGQAGFVMFVLDRTGLADSPIPMMFNRMGVYVGMVHVLLPYMILPCLAVMLTLPDYPLRAAASLGANPVQVFLRVYLPLSLPGLAIGSLLVFIVSLGFFVTPALLGSGADRMVSNVIETEMVLNGNWPFASALAMLLLLLTMGCYVAYAKLGALESVYGAHVGSERAAPRVTTGRRLLPEWWRRPRWGARGWPLALGPFSHLGSRPSHLAVAVPVVLSIMGAAAWLIYGVPARLIAISAIVGLPCVVLAAGVIVLTSRAKLAATLSVMYVGAVLVYLLLPNVILFPMAFADHPVFLSFPGQGFTLRNFAAFFGIEGSSYFGAGGWLPATATSVAVATLVTVLAVPLGVGAAYGLMRGRFPGRRTILYLIVMPLVVPTLITSVALYMFLSEHAGWMLANMGGDLVGVSAGIVAGHCLLALPFVVLICTAGLRNVDPVIERAAASLGASPIVVMRRVVVPLLLPAMAVSAFFAFLTSFDELLIALFLSTPEVVTLPKRMWDGMRNEVDPAIVAISAMLMLLTLVIITCAAVTQRRLERRRS